MTQAMLDILMEQPDTRAMGMEGAHEAEDADETAEAHQIAEKVQAVCQHYTPLVQRVLYLWSKGVALTAIAQTVHRAPSRIRQILTQYAPYWQRYHERARPMPRQRTLPRLMAPVATIAISDRS